MNKKGLSLWAMSANEYLSDKTQDCAHETRIGNSVVFITVTSDSLWIVLEWPDGCRMAFRPVYAPEAGLQLVRSTGDGDTLHLSLKGKTGTYRVTCFTDEEPFIRYTASFTPADALLIPFWPKDILILNNNHPHITKGTMHVNQEGARSGLAYFSTENTGGSVLYMQDLTSLNEYCQDTCTPASGLVGGQWPEIGFSLPVTKDKALVPGKEYTISDAYITFAPEIPGTDVDKAIQFINLLAAVYRRLPQPETHYIDYPDLVKKSIDDIRNNYGCWFQKGNKSYLNAYVCDYKTPPEIMVQLAALVPMLEYAEWAGEDVGLEEKLLEGLPEFYDENLQVLKRWLPATEDNLDKSEEQKKENVMDSWYLHHPLLNLSKLALKGNKMAKELFLKSLEFTIRVAHHFNYEWPVFYHMQTLEVIKAETKPGNGGEKDVAGIYAAVMLQAWEITRKRRYLKEAEKAARTLEKHGLEVFYQANCTAFSANALLRLYIITKDERYLNLSYVCIGSIMRNVHLWSCRYGYGKHYPTFFSMYPLNDAPYTAAYEEREVFAAFHEYLQIAEKVDLLPSVRLLISEFTRHFINRAAYYFPPLLPDEVLSKEVKTGEISRNLHLALEDLQDGWEQSGSVGQEVYGAGLAFGVTPRHYIRIPERHFMIYIDYPVGRTVRKSKKSVSFSILGDGSFKCSMLIIPVTTDPLPDITVTGSDGRVKEEFKGKGNKNTQKEYIVPGNLKVTVSW